MSTPTEPTTPQPKHAGLRWHNPDNLPSAGEPPWRFLLQGEPIGDDDKFYAENFGDWWGTNDEGKLPSPNITYRTTRPLPTPQAEAGDGQFSIADDAQALCYAIEAAGASEALTMCSVLASRLLARCRNELPARHRTAAETVGTGWMPIETAPRDGKPFLAIMERYAREDEDARPRIVFAAFDTSLDHMVRTDADGNGWEPDDYFTHWQPLPAAPGEHATPPATQSALEAAREALEWCLVKVPSPCRCVHFATPPHICVAHTTLAALNAVLTAKGGDGV